MAALSRPPRLLLAAATLILAAAALVAGSSLARAAVAPSTFEGGDGNLLTGAGSDWQDWTGLPGLVLKTDDLGDSQFSGGANGKEQDPGDWGLNNGANPGKSDIRQAAYASETIGADLFLYGAFERVDGAGNANVSFELNATPGLYDNGISNVPIRSEGDLLITFDGNNAQGVVVGMCMWHGDRDGESSAAAGAASFGWYTLPGFGNGGKKLKGSDNCTPISTTGSAEGSMNTGAAVNDSDPAAAVAKVLTNMSNPIADNLFGEMSVNVTDALEDAGVVSPCLDFGSIWLHSRSSDAPLSNMQDYVGPEAIQAGSGCSIDLEKHVAAQKPGAPVPAAGDYVDADTDAGAVYAANGDTLHYLVTLRNDGPVAIQMNTDPPEDDRCTLTEVAKVDAGGVADATPDVLDPDDVWTYSCTYLYSAADAGTYTNTASALGFSPPAPAAGCAYGDPDPCVEDTDPAVVVRAATVEIAKVNDGGPAADQFAFGASSALGAGFSIAGGQVQTITHVLPNTGAASVPATYAVSEDPASAGYRLTGVSCDDADSTADVASRTATINVESGETVRCTYTNRFTSPGIAISKSGPASATAGDLLPYTIAVTNPGQESLADSTVVVTDPQCTTAPALQVKNRDAGEDPTPASLDPGDTWVYACSGQTASGQTSFVNQACVAGTDAFGRQVNACDEATTVLGERQVAGTRTEPGTARLAGRSGCVARAFNAVVRGRSITKVVFRIDGKKRATLRTPDAKGRYKLRVNPKAFRPGSHLLVARSTFASDSGTPPKTMRLRFQRCVRRTVPAFTG